MRWNTVEIGIKRRFFGSNDSISLELFQNIDVLRFRRSFKEMAGQLKLKMFQSLRKYFQILGTYSPGPDESRLFNLKNIFTLFCYIQLFISAVAFTLFKAKTVIEFGLNYYGYMTELLCVFVISTQIYQMNNILKLIEDCEDFIEKSK